MNNKFICFCILLLCLSCSSSKKKLDEKQDDYKEINIMRCTEPLIYTGMDYDSARVICTCLIESSYAIDSTFYDMNEAQRLKFIQANMVKIKEMCGFVD